MLSNHHVRKQRRQLIQLALAIAFLLVIDVIVPSTLQASSSDFVESIMMAVTIGLCIGQINLISIWAALAPGRVMVRLPWSLLLTVVLWTAVCIGLRQAGEPPDDYYQAGVMIGCAQLAAQTPLWIGALIWKWRLASRSQRRRGVHESDTQFSIKHMMIGTMLLAITLAIFRLVLPGEPDWSLIRFDVEIIVILIAASITNLVIVVPCVWIAFVPLDRLHRMLGGWGLVVLVVSLVEDIVLVALLGYGPPNHMGMVYLVTVLINFAQCAVVVFVLLKLRSLGFRLVRLGDSRPTPRSPG